MAEAGREREQKFKPGTEVVAKYNFDGTSKDDLPFRKNDFLTIVQASRDPNWYKAKKPDGREGMIPVTYVRQREAVKLTTMVWYHGKIDREEAERLLHPRKDGLFLVRESVNFPGHYTLCVCFEGIVNHYRVIRENNMLTVDEEEFFETLTELVEHYQKDADGLCTRLRKPLDKVGPQSVEVNRSDIIAAGWAIFKKDLTLGKPLGQGEFGDVYLGKYQGMDVAVKMLKDSEAAQTFLREASVMTYFKHPNLVRLLGVSVDGFPEKPIYIVTEFLSKGNLADYLRSRGRSVITKKDQADFARDVSAGMAYLESKDFVHRDLSARNVLISEEGIAKVADFGLARNASHDLEGGKFPIKWTAPEALRQSKFSTKSDVWSFGIFLWELYSFGRIPYPRIPISEVVQHVERGYRMDSPDGCPEEIYQMMRKCWDLEADKRPTFHELHEALVQRALKTTK